MLGMDVGIDLGTATVLVYVDGQGIVLREPSIVAYDSASSKILAVGHDAHVLLGRTPGNIVAVRPLKEGVISDFDMTEAMIKYFLRKICSSKIIMPRVMICVPSAITDVEARAVLQAARAAGARKVYIIEEPVAAAIGAGLDINIPSGNMVVDIGGGTTDVAVITLSGVAVNASLKIAGDNFDNTIIKYIKQNFNVLIGERTAEAIKCTIGSVYPSETAETMDVKGRNLLSGLPEKIEVSSKDIYEALLEPATQIGNLVQSVLERTPPELIADISDHGIILTGGGAQLKGLDHYLMDRTHIDVRVAPDPESCVAIGTGKALHHVDNLQKNPELLYNQRIIIGEEMLNASSSDQ